MRKTTLQKGRESLEFVCSGEIKKFNCINDLVLLYEKRDSTRGALLHVFRLFESITLL